MEELLYGSVFLQDADFTQEKVEEGLSRMKAMKMNTVVVWPPLFFEDGKRKFDRHLKFLDTARKFGFKVVIELTGQVTDLEFMPNCDYKDEYAVKDKNVVTVKGQNGLGELNYNHPEVRKKLREMILDTVRAYKDHPALHAWDIWNETHFKSYDKYTLCEFRRWLEGKYKTVAKLNGAWAKSYTSFEQVEFEEVLWASIVPFIDLETFRNDNLGEIVKFISCCVKELDKVHKTVADNVMSNVAWDETDRGTDDWKVAENADQFGISFYPKTGGRLLKKNEPWLRCLTFDGARTAAGGKFFLSEMQSHSYSEIYTTERVSPEEITTWGMEAISHGASALVFWKLYPFSWGLQIGGRGLLLADGSLTKRSAAAEQLGEFIRGNKEIAAAMKPANSAGVLFDRNNIFTVKAVNCKVKGLIGDSQVCESVQGLYRIFFGRNADLDIVSRGDLAARIGKLRTLFLTYQVSLDDDAAKMIRKFVEGGGTLIGNHPFLDIDGNGRLRKKLPGGPLNDLLKVAYTDNIMVEKPAFRFKGMKRAVRCPNPIEVQELEFKDKAGTEVLAEVGGMPLVIMCKAGKGRIIYFCSPIWNYEGSPELEDAIFAVLEELGCVAQVKCTEGVRTSILESGSAKFLFVFNYGGLKKIRVETDLSAGKPELVFGKAKIKLSGKVLELSGSEHVTVLKS